MRLTHRPALSCVAFRLGARCLRAPPRASSASCWEQPPQCLPCGPLLAAADGGSSQQHEVVRDEDLPHSNRSVLVPPGDRRQKGRLQYTQKEMSGSSARNCGSAMNQLSRSVFEVSLACSIVLSHVAPARSATNFRRAFSQNKLRVWRSLRCGNRRYSHRWWKTCGGEVSRSSLACLACLVRCPLLPLARDSVTQLNSCFPHPLALPGSSSCQHSTQMTNYFLVFLRTAQTWCLAQPSVRESAIQPPLAEAARRRGLSLFPCMPRMPGAVSIAAFGPRLGDTVVSRTLGRCRAHYRASSTR